MNQEAGEAHEGGGPREGPAGGKPRRAAKNKKVKFEVYGKELVEKQVTPSGKSGRVYLPVDWLGKRVKIIRID